MNMENIIVDRNFFDESSIVIDTTIGSLAKLKKLKTSEEKFIKLFKSVTSEKALEQEEVIEVQEEKLYEEPVVEKKEETLKEEKPVYSFEQPPITQVTPITPEPKKEERPVYSFEQPQVYKENKLTAQNFDYSAINGLTSTEKFERDFERAEGTIEKQVLKLGIKELKAKDKEIEERKTELEKILAQEKKIKEEKEKKRKEIEDSVNDKKNSVSKIETAVGKARQVDNLNKVAQEKALKEVEEVKIREAKFKEEQEAILSQREKVLSEIPFDLEKEKEKTPKAVEKSGKKVNIEEGYDVIEEAKEFIRRIDPDYSFLEETKSISKRAM